MDNHADAEQIVSGLYRQILKRDPDPGGLQAYAGLIQRASVSQGVETIVKEFLASEEYARVTARETDVKAAINAPGKALVNGQRISHIVSLGTHCQTSAILKKHQLKPYSLPFDWLFTSPDTILDCLANDFRTFLDRSHYRSLHRPSGEPGAEHLWYREQHGVQDFFTHRDPLGDADYQYFQRAVERFRKLMRSADGKLFVMISRPEFDLRDKFSELSRAISRATRNAALICIQLVDSSGIAGCHGMRRLVRDGDHALYEFAPSSQEDGIGFPEPLDDMAVLRLILEYQLDLRREVDVRVDPALIEKAI